MAPLFKKRIMAAIESQQMRRIHALLSELDVHDMRGTFVQGVTNDRTDDIKDISHTEANLLIKGLMELREERVNKMRGKIIYYLCTYGMTNHAGQPDYTRINKFIRNIGSNNPKKKKLYYLSPTEMRGCLNQVEAMVKKEFA